MLASILPEDVLHLLFVMCFADPSICRAHSQPFTTLTVHFGEGDAGFIETDSLRSNVPLVLSHVCTSWRKAAVSYSPMWTKIFASIPRYASLQSIRRLLDIVQVYLSRTPTAALFMSFIDRTQSSLGDRRHAYTFGEVLSTIQTYSTRCRKLTIHAPPTSIKALACISTPSLQEFQYFDSTASIPSCVSMRPDSAICTALVFLDTTRELRKLSVVVSLFAGGTSISRRTLIKVLPLFSRTYLQDLRLSSRSVGRHTWHRFHTLLWSPSLAQVAITNIESSDLEPCTDKSCEKIVVTESINVRQLYVHFRSSEKEISLGLFSTFLMPKLQRLEIAHEPASTYNIPDLTPLLGKLCHLINGGQAVSLQKLILSNVQIDIAQLDAFLEPLSSLTELRISFSQPTLVTRTFRGSLVSCLMRPAAKIGEVMAMNRCPTLQSLTVINHFAELDGDWEEYIRFRMLDGLQRVCIGMTGDISVGLDVPGVKIVVLSANAGK